jgi:lipopolysaccharide transport protein LptA
MRTQLCLLLVLGLGAGWCPAQDAASKPAPATVGRTTEITAEKEAQFDAEARIAIFTGTVEVKDPQFRLKCDKLTVYLDKAQGGLDRAEAEGNVVIVNEKPGTDNAGKAVTSRGKAQRAIYAPKTGEVTLIGWPQIEQGMNLHLAADPSTRMILNNDGRMRTIGRSKTVIKDTEKE